MLSTGAFNRYFLKAAFEKLTGNIGYRSRNGLVNFNAALIKLLNGPCAHTGANHSVAAGKISNIVLKIHTCCFIITNNVVMRFTE